MCDSPLNRLHHVLSPVSINALEFAKQMLEIHGRIRASHFSGVRDALFSGKDDASEVEYAIQGEKGPQQEIRFAADHQRTVAPGCQRCLGEMEYTLHHTAHFDLVGKRSRFAGR